MIIPYTEISPDALQGLIEEFITREGTDYGEMEYSLAQKVSQVERQLARVDIVFVFDSATESLSILTKHDASIVESSGDLAY